MRILLVVPYYGGSHRAWADGYARHSRHDVDLLTMPARFWKWRMHGGAAMLARRLRLRVTEGAPPPDVILATDMVNLPAFLGLARDLLDGVPAALYCHENQLTYPLREGERRDLAYPMINWLSMVAADRVLFNSRFHLENWFRALPRMLKHFPDASHVPLIPAVRAKSQVLPVGVALADLDAARPHDDVGRNDASEAAPLILWNQRWEYDKDPATFFRALRELVKLGIPFRVALAGSNVRQDPEEFERARDWLGDRLVHYGRAPLPVYRRLLWDADVVVSTATHEFFGIAVVEAIFCESFPVLPKRLAYPELLPPAYHPSCLYEDFGGLVARLSQALTEPDATRSTAHALRSSVAGFDWRKMAPQYDRVLTTLAKRA
ncbi:MAG: tRNA-queuosine alpha-mannosyltransferase domain-containing protein [Anaerolineae bacterium]